MTLENILENVEVLSGYANYEQSLNELNPFWKRIDTNPQTDNLTIELKAELLLQCGIISGFLGNRRKIGQFWAKKNLYRARNLFIEKGYFVKVAKCENNLALCCIRNGQFKVAEKWLRIALKRPINKNSDEHLQTHLYFALLKLNNCHYDEMVAYSEIYKRKIEIYGTEKTKLHYFQNLSIGLKNIGRFEDSLYYLEIANSHAIKFNLSIQGEIQNAFAMFYYKLGEYEKAHLHCDKAIETFNKSGDSIREGFSYETKSQILRSENRFRESEHNANIAVSILNGTGEYAIFIEALISKFCAEFLSGNTVLSLDTYNYAINISRNYLSKDYYRKTVKAFANLIDKNNSDTIEIEIPECGEADYVLINKTDVAVVTKDNPQNGEYGLIQYENKKYIGKIERDENLQLLIMQLRDGGTLIIGSELIQNARKIIGICRKENNYKFEKLR